MLSGNTNDYIVSSTKLKQCDGKDFAGLDIRLLLDSAHNDISS